MIRRILMVAAAAALPVSAIAAAGVMGNGVAGAAVPVPLNPTHCALGGNVSFTLPGLSLNGSVVSAPTSTTNATSTFSSCAAAGTITGGGALVITTKNTKCPKTGGPSGCMKGLFIQGAASGLGSTTTLKTLGKDVKKLPLTLTETPGSFTVKNKPITEAEVLPGGACGASEVGFSISGTVKTAPKSSGVTTSTLVACLGTDNLGGNFFTDLTAGDTITSVAIDPATSSITLG